MSHHELDVATETSTLGTADVAVAAPFAAAMRAHQAEQWPQMLGVQHRSDGSMNWVHTGVWFGQEPLRERVLDALIASGIRGPVLDAGAGAGRAALKLQEAGVDVLALDCEPACIDLLKERGVRRFALADVRDFETSERFQNILFLDSTFGLVGDVDAVGPLLEKLGSLLLPEGRVVVQDVDIAIPVNSMEWRFVFRDQTGPYFRWLNFGFAGLRDSVRRHGWSARRISTNTHPFYVAELRPMEPARTRAWAYVRRNWFEGLILGLMVWAILTL